MTDLAKILWDNAIYRGIDAMLDEAIFPVEVLEELVKHYRETIVTSAIYLEQKLEQLKKQQKSA